MDTKFELEHLPWFYKGPDLESEVEMEKYVKQCTEKNCCINIAKNPKDYDENDKDMKAHRKYLIRSFNQYNILWYDEKNKKYHWDRDTGMTWEQLCRSEYWRTRDHVSTQSLLNDIVQIYNRDTSEKVKRLLDTNCKKLVAEFERLLRDGN